MQFWNPQVLSTGSVLLHAAAASWLPGVLAVMEVKSKCNHGHILKSDVYFLSSFPKEVSLLPHMVSQILDLFFPKYFTTYLVIFLFDLALFSYLSKLGTLKGISSLTEEGSANQFGHQNSPFRSSLISSMLSLQNPIQMCALWSHCGKTAWNSILASAGFHWLWWFGTISICVMHDFQVSLCQRDKMCFVFWQLSVVCVLIYLLGWSHQLVWVKVAIVSISTDCHSSVPGTRNISSLSNMFSAFLG